MEKNSNGKLTILVAEDDKGHFALVRKNLWRTCIDAEIVHFTDGQKLLNYLMMESSCPEQFHKGNYLVLLDIKMPGLDGIEVLGGIKKIPEFKKMPVIMLTTTNNPNEIDRCYQNGCSFYIVKPSDYRDFMEAIEHLGSFLSLSSLLIPPIDPHNIQFRTSVQS